MKINNISKSFNKKKVVNNVSFNLPRGKVISLIGPNGAGKSTVLNIISRLINKDHGQVSVEDLDLKKWNSKDLSKKLAILPQSNHSNIKLTVKELVAFGRFPHSGNRLTEHDHKYINEAIDYMELTEFQDKFIDQLSGGQRQRAYIAMVIAQDTEFIFLDEPTNNLDIYHSSKMMKTIKDLCHTFNKTIIIVLHEINFAAKYSDYIGAFKDGKLFKFGSIDEVFTKENLKTLYEVEFDIIQKDGKPIALYY